MSANDFRAAVIDEVNEVVRCQAVINRHEHGADLGHGIKRFELAVSIWRDISGAIAFRDAECLQNRRPTIAAIEKLFVSQPQIAVDNGFAGAVQLARAARKFDWGERSLHLTGLKGLSEKRRDCDSGITKPAG